MLNSFAMLEKEFNVPTVSQQNLEERLTSLQPPASFQDPTVQRTASAPASAAATYENVTMAGDRNTSADYENVNVVQIVSAVAARTATTPPTPLPRTTSLNSNPSSTANTTNVEVKSPPPSLIPVPRTKSYQAPKQSPADDRTSSTLTQAQSELPRFINFVPKVVSTIPAAPNASANATITINNAIISSASSAPIKKCIRLPDDAAATSALEPNYADSSSNSSGSSDEDAEKSYEPHAQRVYVSANNETTANKTETTTTNHEENANHSSASDTPSTTSEEDEEDGEKLGPPSIVDGPGPSEAYFNFMWSTNMLPTIGEVEEEFSSLEQTSANDAKR